MNNREIIIKLINTDESNYNDLIFSHFFNWCDKNSKFNIPLKLLVNNESLFQWYCNQWKCYVEDAFINDYRTDITAVDNNSEVFLNIFKTYPQEVDLYYPSVILKMIKLTLIQT